METSKREWTWRDSGNHGVAIRALNLASDLVGFSRKSFVPEQLMEKAARRAGLDDFGPPTFREGLDLLCREYNADRRITGLGQIAGREMIVGTLANRLQVIDWYKTHPEVGEEKIETPWVITGLIRSGTTLTSALFNLDARLRRPLVGEGEFPIPPVQLATRYSDERIARSARQIERLDKLAPPMKAIHPIEATYPQECVLITQMDFQSILFTSIASSPGYQAWYSHSDKRSAYALHRQLLQIWQSTVPTVRWGSKAPNHMHGIDALMATYPDARLVWCHRDPLVCIPSIASLSATFLRPFSRHVDPHEVGRLANEHWLAGVQKLMAYDKSRADGGWCRHLYYNDLVADSAAALKAAYRHFGDEVDPLHERKIKAWVKQRPKNTFGIHKYSLEDFGLDARKMREQYAEYIERYRVPLEHKD